MKLNLKLMEPMQLEGFGKVIVTKKYGRSRHEVEENREERKGAGEW